ncbi:MAG: alkaline phosphatase family protein [Bacteroidota bacterium]|nr:alkaline phosphatase family protein [Bacteroidota bacterium]
MKVFVVIFFILQTGPVWSQQKDNLPNVFIITTDGFRWQEIFNGADSSLINNPRFVEDTGLLKQQYWSDDLTERRKKLLPFFWNVIQTDGTISGNRNYGNEVNVYNLYKISYPGYNEILTGYADKRLIPNLAIRNRNENVLEFLNRQQGYTGKVVAFSSWNMIPFILDEKRSHIPVNSGYEMLDDSHDSINSLINQVQRAVRNKGKTRHDLLTYASAKNYIENEHPKVVFLALGETDEFAHMGKYDQYLQKAHQFDQMIAELWYYVQTDPFYKDNTTFILTTDHGRGSKSARWQNHGFWIKGSGQAWMAMLGPGILALGEKKGKETIYQKQIASTIAVLVGEKFESDHPVAKPLGEIKTTASEKESSKARSILNK